MTATVAPLDDLTGTSWEISQPVPAVPQLFPVRALNRWALGRCPSHPNESCACERSVPAVSSCGVAVSETGSILISEGEHGAWGSEQLATCKSPWCCDFCVRAHRADALERAEFVISEHFAAGGCIALATFTVEHDRGTRLAGQLWTLNEAWKGIKGLKAWKDLGVSGYSRTLHVSCSPVNGWHGHYHVLLFFDDGVTPKLDLVEGLRPKWNEKLRQHDGDGGDASVKARYVDSLEQALYPWRETEETDPSVWGSDDWADVDPWENTNKWDGDGLSTWDLASLASVGHRRALALWHEFYDATSADSVTSWSRGLTKAWNQETERRKTKSPVARPKPVALVANDVWNAAHAQRGGALAEAGLRVGARVGSVAGVAVMVEFWARGLGRAISVVESDGLPFVFFPTEERVT